MLGFAPNLIRAMEADSGLAPTWGQVMAEFHPILASPLSEEGERLLLQILDHDDGPLRLSASQDLPHSMSPEDMLKSLSIQALAKWTGLAHVEAMRRAESTAASSALRSVIRAVIRQAIA